MSTDRHHATGFEPTRAPSANDAIAEVGGDPPCWLDQVCADCGRMIEDRYADTCPVCGAARAP